MGFGGNFVICFGSSCCCILKLCRCSSLLQLAVESSLSVAAHGRLIQTVRGTLSAFSWLPFVIWGFEYGATDKGVLGVNKALAFYWSYIYLLTSYLCWFMILDSVLSPLCRWKVLKFLGERELADWVSFRGGGWFVKGKGHKGACLVVLRGGFFFFFLIFEKDKINKCINKVPQSHKVWPRRQSKYKRLRPENSNRG